MKKFVLKKGGFTVTSPIGVVMSDGIEFGHMFPRPTVSVTASPVSPIIAPAPMMGPPLMGPPLMGPPMMGPPMMGPPVIGSPVLPLVSPAPPEALFPVGLGPTGPSFITPSGPIPTGEIPIFAPTGMPIPITRKVPKHHHHDHDHKHHNNPYGSLYSQAPVILNYPLAFKHKGGGVIIIANDKSNVILLKRNGDNLLMDGGGEIDGDNVIDGAKREFYEETTASLKIIGDELKSFIDLPHDSGMYRCHFINIDHFNVDHVENLRQVNRYRLKNKNGVMPSKYNEAENIISVPLSEIPKERKEFDCSGSRYKLTERTHNIIQYYKNYKSSGHRNNIPTYTLSDTLHIDESIITGADVARIGGLAGLHPPAAPLAVPPALVGIDGNAEDVRILRIARGIRATNEGHTQYMEIKKE
jgi:hypothetical protein